VPRTTAIARPGGGRRGHRTRLPQRAAPRAATGLRGQRTLARRARSTEDPAFAREGLARRPPPTQTRSLHVANAFAHIELSTDDLAKAKTFYKKVFAWKLEDSKGAPYTMINVGEGTGGGMQKRPRADVPTSWLAYVAVDDVKKTLAKAKSAGAEITLEYHPIGDMGAIGVFTDPSGATLGVWEAGKKAPKDEAKKAAKKAKKAAKKAKAKAEKGAAKAAKAEKGGKAEKGAKKKPAAKKKKPAAKKKKPAAKPA
jgi:predicted enzyme related to lactoylglutathione lyase